MADDDVAESGKFELEKRPPRAATNFRMGFEYAVCLYLKRYTSLNTGYPHFSRAYVAANIDRPDTSAEELDEYRAAHCWKLQLVRALMIISTVIFSARLLMMPVTIFREMDYTDVASNLHWHSDQVNQFNCFITNCSRSVLAEQGVTQIEFARFLNELPYFTICHPHLSAWQDSTQFLGLEGAIVAILTSMAVFLPGMPLPIGCWLRPTGNLLLMFLVAPHVTRRVVERRARDLLELLEDSFKNFELSPMEIPELGHHGNQVRAGERKLPTTYQLMNPTSFVGHHSSAHRPLAGDAMDFLLLEHQTATMALPTSGAVANELAPISGLSSDLLRGRAILRLFEEANMKLRRELLLSAADANKMTVELMAEHSMRSRQLAATRIRPAMFRLPDGPAGGLSSQPSSSSSSSPSSSSATISSIRAERRNSNESSLIEDQRREAFAQDSISIIRTSWWHTKATRAICKLSLPSMLNLLFIIPVALLVLVHLMDERHKEMMSFASKLSSWNCHMWLSERGLWTEELDLAHDEQALGEREIFHLNQFQARLRPLEMIATVLQASWPFMVILFVLLAYFLANAELICWLYEIQFGLALAIEFIKQLDDVHGGGDDQFDDKIDWHRQLDDRHQQQRPKRDRSRRRLCYKQNNSDFVPERQRFDMEILRAQLNRMIDVKLIVVRHNLFGPDWSNGATNSPLQSALALESFAREHIREHQMDLGGAIELLEKLYINLRIFAEHVDHYGSVMSVMVAFINMYIYVLVSIGVFLMRSIDNFVLPPLALIVCGWLSASGVILLASNLHAKAKGLSAIIWSLLAVTCKSRNIRIKHLRALWLKQVDTLDQDGGLALKAFGVRITYVRNIQLIVGTATLVVFVLRL